MTSESGFNELKQLIQEMRLQFENGFRHLQNIPLEERQTNLKSINEVTTPATTESEYKFEELSSSVDAIGAHLFEVDNDLHNKIDSDNFNKLASLVKSLQADLTQRDRDIRSLKAIVSELLNRFYSDDGLEARYNEIKEDVKQIRDKVHTLENFVSALNKEAVARICGDDSYQDIDIKPLPLSLSTDKHERSEIVSQSCLQFDYVENKTGSRNKHITEDIDWVEPIKRYLEKYEAYRLSQGLPVWITTKELLARPLNELGGLPDSKSHQMRVAKILIDLGWKRIWHRKYKGIRKRVFEKQPAILETKDSDFELEELPF